MALIIGIDDAGRGPVIGPMVLAGCMIDDKVTECLIEMGVKDSKMLTPERRDELAPKITDVCKQFHVEITHAHEIDSTLNSGTNLNKLEAIKCARIINELNEGKEKIKVIIDCPSINREAWKITLLEFVENKENLEFVVVHKADRDYPIVGAASILAKTTRDAEIEKLKKLIGVDFGSGYPSDPTTTKFLKENHKNFSEHKIFRTTWQTYKNLIDKTPDEQKTLF